MFLLILGGFLGLWPPMTSAADLTLAAPAIATETLGMGAERPTLPDLVTVQSTGRTTPVEGDAPPLPGRIMSGMMTYLADAATFEVCASGAVYPVAMEAAYLALERAYLASRSAPGAPLYVVIDGHTALRPAMEGPDREMVVVDQYLTARPEQDCQRHRPDATLVDTFWQLDMLAGKPFPKDVTERRPHLVLENGEAGAYRATVGCNRMGGAFSRSGMDGLTLAPGAMTLKACRAPLSTLERSFSNALRSVVRYDIAGDTLILRDADAGAAAVFSAVAF